MTTIEFPDGVQRPGVLRCCNYSSHLGRWAIPISQTFAEEDLCGLDGCL